MVKSLDGLIKFPVDAQRSSLFCSLASIILYRNEYTEDTPFYCGKNKRICVQCGNCNISNLEKHHLNIYHHLITITGCAYLWEDKAVGDSYTTEYQADKFSEIALDRLSLSLQVYGFNYESWNKDTAESMIFSRIKKSIDNNQPVLIKLGGGDVWAVITGYDTEKQLPYLQKMNHAPKLNKEWYEKLRNIVFVTDKVEGNVSCEGIFRNMYQHLMTENRVKLHQKIQQGLKAEQDGKKLGMWLNKMNGLIIENRWHASECYQNVLLPMMKDNDLENALSKAAKIHLHFHDQVWKIWEILGVTPQTGYCLPKNIDEILNNSQTRTELSSLYQELFALDQEVAFLLKECMETES